MCAPPTACRLRRHLLAGGALLALLLCNRVAAVESDLAAALLAALRGDSAALTAHVATRRDHRTSRPEHGQPIDRDHAVHAAAAWELEVATAIPASLERIRGLARANGFDLATARSGAVSIGSLAGGGAPLATAPAGNGPLVEVGLDGGGRSLAILAVVVAGADGPRLTGELAATTLNEAGRRAVAGWRPGADAARDRAIAALIHDRAISEGWLGLCGLHGREIARHPPVTLLVPAWFEETTHDSILMTGADALAMREDAPASLRFRGERRIVLGEAIVGLASELHLPPDAPAAIAAHRPWRARLDGVERVFAPDRGLRTFQASACSTIVFGDPESSGHIRLTFVDRALTAVAVGGERFMRETR